MSMRYPGGLIASTPVNANYPSGVWTQAQTNVYNAQNVWQRDQYWPYTTLLLHGDGTNGAQNNTFLDSSTNNFTITRNGNTTQGAFTPYDPNGYWSNYFDGTGDYITSSQSQTIPATGDFTIDGWFWCNTYTNYPSILSQGTSGNAGRFNIYINNDGKFGVQIGATSSNIGSAVPTNQWVHFAVTRSGSTVTVYINGVSTGTATNGTSIQNTTPSIGSEWTGDPYRWIGYLSNIRVSNVVRTISLPSSPFVADANTVLLACQSNRFIDTSTTAATLTPNGNVSVQAFQPFPGATTWSASVLGGSGYFDGSGDFLTCPNAGALTLGSGNWTIEAWVYLTSTSPSYQGILDWRSGPNAGQPELGLAGATFTWYMSNTGNMIQSSALNINTWYHVAVCKSGSSTKMFVNGVQAGSTYTDTNTYSSTNPIRIGNTYDNFYIYGYVTDARVVVGSALYTTTFTPPTAPLAAITNTQLLLNFTNGGIFDNAQMNNLETVGNAQISTSVVKYGTGSMYFDGTGDYLTSRNSDLFRFGTGDFTVEFWLNTTDTAFNIIGLITSATGNWAALVTGGLFYWQTNYATTNLFSTSATNIINGAWNHIAVVRSGTTTTVYFNGVSQTSATDNTNYSGVGDLRIGSGANGDLLGYIDDLRITKGAARYIGNFTPPIARMPNQ